MNQGFWSFTTEFSLFQRISSSSSDSCRALFGRLPQSAKRPEVVSLSRPVKENALKTSAIVSFANFQCIQILRHPGLAFDWPYLSFFDH